MIQKTKAKAKRSSLSPIVTPDPFARSPSLALEREVNDLNKVSVNPGRYPQIKSANATDSDQDLAVAAAFMNCSASSTPSGRRLHPYSNGYQSEEKARPARSPVGKLFPPPGLSPLNPSHSIGGNNESQDELGSMRNPNGMALDKSRARRDSMSSTGSRVKLDKVLGTSPSGTLACLYLVSGLGKVGASSSSIKVR